MTTIPQAVETMQRVEESRDVLRHKVDGWSAWPIVRFEVVQMLRSGPRAAASPMMTRGQRARMAARDLLHLPAIRQHRYMIGTLSSGLLDEHDGRYYDIFFDSIQAVVSDAFRLENLNNLAFLPRRLRAAYPATITTNIVDLGSGLLSRLPSAPDISASAEAISRIIRDDLGVAEATPSWVALRLRYFSHARRLYALLMKRVKPEALLVSDQSNYALSAAALDERIPVVELQHGIADRNHPVYAWAPYALSYRRQMPLPDRIFLYGEHWRRELAAGGFWGESLRITGSALMDQYRSRRRPDEGTTIVFTAQGFETRKAAEWLSAGMLEAGPSVRLFIRLHPYYAQGRDDFMAVLGDDPRIRVLSAEESPSTYELLSRAHLHVSISSSTHYDALGLCVPTVILPFHSHEFVEPLRVAGHASVADSPEALAEFIRKAHEMKVPDRVSADYFTDSSVERVRRELGDLVGVSDGRAQAEWTAA